jgi:hypothetical protein
LPLPPPPLFIPGQEFEMDHLRKDSCALLLPGDSVDGNDASTLFQLVQDAVPEPYQTAVSSRENICNVGIGDERRAASQRVLNGGRYESGTPRKQLSHTVSNGAVPIQRGIGPGAPTSYEQVDRRYGGNEFASNSSPKLHSRVETMPTRMTSSGQLVMRGVPPVAASSGFRRHQSAVEAGSDDYTRLNHGREHGVRPPPLMIAHRGERMSSVSSMPTSTPTSRQPHQLPRLDKRHSITNYSRESSPSDTLEVSKPPLNLTPTSEAPPPYRDAAMSSTSSPYTPSGSSSLLENGAYEGSHRVTRDSLKVSDACMGPGGAEEQQAWYHNSSDPSIDREPPMNSSDGLHRHSGVADSRSPRSSSVSNRPVFYGEEGLSRLPHPPPTVHFHTVVV